MKIPLLIGIVLVIVIVASVAIYLTMVQPSGQAAPTTTPTETTTTGIGETASKPPTGITESPSSQTTPTLTSEARTEITPARIRSYKDLLGSFEHVKMEFKEITNGVTNRTTLEYTMYPSETRVINGVESIKIVIVIGTDTSEQTTTLWISRDLDRIMEAEFEGTRLTGPMADSYGKYLLSSFMYPIMTSYSVWSFGVVITATGAQALVPGWTVTSYRPITVTIGGHSYNGWELTMENTGSPSNTKTIHVKVAELKPNTWYAVYLSVVQKDGSQIELSITELTPRT